MGGRPDIVNYMTPRIPREHNPEHRSNTQTEYISYFKH